MSEMLNIDEQIEKIDKDIELQEWFIKRGEALDRLINTDDFQLVFVEGYLEIEAQRVFELLTHPLTVKPEDNSNYMSQLDTIKNIGRYIGCNNYPGMVAISATNAKKAKDDLIKMKQELIAGKGE